MKRILILTILLMSSLAWAGSTTVVVGQGGAGGGGAFCTGCTGELLFCWEITAADVDLADSGGCSAGDAQATAQSGSSLESAPTGKTGYAIYSPGTYDAHYFTVSSDDIIDDSIGTIQLDFYIHTWTNLCELFRLDVDSNNEMRLFLDTGDDLRLSYKGNGQAVSATSSGAGLVVDTWYTLTAKWRVSAGVQSLSISIDGVGEIATSSTDLTAFASTPGANALKFGNGAGYDGDQYVKNIKIWSTWQ